MESKRYPIDVVTIPHTHKFPKEHIDAITSMVLRLVSHSNIELVVCPYPRSTLNADIRVTSINRPAMLDSFHAHVNIIYAMGTCVCRVGR